MRTFDDAERRARLAARHLLLPRLRTDDVPAISDAVVALHSTDPVSVYLSVFARTTRPSREAVEAALYDERTLVRHHALRRTLWVATPEVARMLHASASRRLVEPERRQTLTALAASGVDDPEAWLADAEQQVLADLAEHEPSTARDVGRRLAGLRHPVVIGGERWGQQHPAHTRVLLLLGFGGRILRTRPLGTWVSGAYAYAVADDWLTGGVTGLDEREGRAALVRRYLERFGPVSMADVQWWLGSTVTATRTALADTGAEAVEVAGGPAWVAPGDVHETPAEPWVAALPSLDPTTMGWKERAWYLPAAAAETFDRAGNAGPTLWVDGRVVGAWATDREGGWRTHYFEQVAASRKAELDERLRALADAVGETRYTERILPRFATGAASRG